MNENEHVAENKPESKLGAKPNVADDLKSLPIPEVEKKLGSSPDGLTQAEAEKRLTQYGPNEIEEKKTNLFLKFLSYFWGRWLRQVRTCLITADPTKLPALNIPFNQSA